jgi:hypothetical protein
MPLQCHRRLDVLQLEAFTGPGSDRQELIEWKMAAHGGAAAVYKLDTITRGAHMQRQFTIELRVDFADQEKLPALKQVLQQAARHAFATAQLISDNPKSTQIAIFSDDFFSGHEEIKLLDDVIQQGLDHRRDEDSGPASELEQRAWPR